jgi:hypothetical protein
VQKGRVGKASGRASVGLRVICTWRNSQAGQHTLPTRCVHTGNSCVQPTEFAEYLWKVTALQAGRARHCAWHSASAITPRDFPLSKCSPMASVAVCCKVFLPRYVPERLHSARGLVAVLPLSLVANELRKGRCQENAVARPQSRAGNGGLTQPPLHALPPPHLLPPLLLLLALALASFMAPLLVASLNAS